MNHWLLWPPVVFLLILGAALILLRGMSVFSFPAKDGAAGGKRKAYACGEDMPAGRGQPDYSQFFPFAFFFTIMLMMTSWWQRFPPATGRPLRSPRAICSAR